MSDSASQAMENITAQWWNAVTRGLNIRGNFQLVQGNISLGITSQAIWSLMDTIPPSSVVQFWTPGSYNSFSSNYGSVLSRIHSSASSSFQTTMADYFQPWMTYLQAHPPAAPINQTLPALFQSWAYANMPPAQAQSALTALQGALIDPIGQAQQMWIAAGGTSGIKAFNPSIETLDAAISTAPSGTVELNSQTESSDVTKTWANGAVEGFYDIFFGEANTSYESTTVVVTNAGVDININFTHVVTIPIAPLEMGTVVAGPTTYQAWYVPSALQTAYNNNNYQIWQPGSPDWNSFFGPSGSMLRGTAALVIVDGINVSLNSTASIAKEEQTDVRAAFAAGFFPFFGVEGQGGWHNDMHFNDSGQIVASASSPTGAPQVLGIIVADMPNLIAREEVMAARRNRRARLPQRTPLVLRGRSGGGPIVPAPAVITVAWTAAALQGLHNLGLSPLAEAAMSNWITTWAQGRAAGWALNQNVQYVSNLPQYTATARVVAINGANRTVNIVAFA